MTLAEYQQHQKDELDANIAASLAEKHRAYEALSDDEKEARAAREGTYISASDDAFAELTLYVLLLVMAVCAGAVLLVVSLLIGRAPLAVVGGTVVGVLGGAILLPLLYFGGLFVFAGAARLVADHRTARHLVFYTFNAVMVIVLLLPTLLTVIVTLLLW